MKKRHQQKLVIIAFALLILFNIPFILIFDGSESVLGFPSFYVFIFTTWLISILLSYFIIKRFHE
ncbi:hypothetical protein [Psychroflexus planctonicus]|uniref:hypothetical protein n=1 Tax=Psychroflexus planctonicus TaxID=1526575 RepID=UPI0016688330|nr:hypothetical protein [Psychroflexus planctonicus]